MATLTIDVSLEPGDVRIEPATFQAFVRDPQDPIVQDLRRRAQAVSSAMVVPRGEGPEAGRLQRSKRTEENLASPYTAVVVGRDDGTTDHLRFVLPPGTRPHEIVPSRAKALRWVTRGGGVRFARRVFHPGYQPTDWMNAALPAAVRD